MPSDYRYDPFSDTSTAVSITNELHVIPTASPFTIRLSEVPDKAAALTMKIRDVLSAAITAADATSITVANGDWFASGNVITVDSEQMLVGSAAGDVLTVSRGYNSTVATTHTSGTAVLIDNSMTKVSANPTSGQFWPDYSTGADNDENWNTGSILFNAADAGKTVIVSYNGIGTLASVNSALTLPSWAYDRGDGSDGDFVATGTETISGVKNYKSFTIPTGISVRVGKEPLIIKCQEAVVIDGILNGEGNKGLQDDNQVIAAPVGGSGAGSNPYDSTTENSGIEPEAGTGGGGGANGRFSTGSNSCYINKIVATPGTSPNTAAISIMAQTLLPKAGGGGGYNNGTRDVSAAGGGGGGTITIACDEYTLTGTLDVSAGEYSSQRLNSNFRYPGGGSGGASIHIIGKQVIIRGKVTVKGGKAGDCDKLADYSTAGAGWYKIFTAGA